MSQNKESFPHLLYNGTAYSTPKKINLACPVTSQNVAFCLSFVPSDLGIHNHDIHQPAASKNKDETSYIFSEQTYIGISPTVTAAVATKPVTCCFHSKCFPCMCLL